MEEYRPLLYVASLFIAWWAQAQLSNPLAPQGIYYLLLIISSLWLLGGSVILFKEHSRPSALFTAALALCPHLFYLELHLLMESPDFRAERTSAVYTVYNAFRYLLLFAVFCVIIRRLIQKLGSFADENPQHPGRT